MASIFQRSSRNPILKPDPDLPWASEKVYNPSLVMADGRYHMFYRALGQAWVSKIGHASSLDGEDFVRDDRPVLEPELAIEKDGLEDPRVTRVNGRYYLTYTAYDGETARLCSAVSGDLVEWEKQGEMIPEWDGRQGQSFLVSWDQAQTDSEHLFRWNKAGAIFPRKINGGFFMIFGDRHLWTAKSTDGAVWTPDYEPLIRPRPGKFDSAHVEMGPPPIETDQGWLVLYHGIDLDRRYSVGVLFLDRDDPRQILYRSDEPVFEPETDYEFFGAVDIVPGGLDSLQTMAKPEIAEIMKIADRNGLLPRVVFVCGAVAVDGRLKIYYGAGDSVICTASAPLKDILALVGKG